MNFEDVQKLVDDLSSGKLKRDPGAKLIKVCKAPPKRAPVAQAELAGPFKVGRNFGMDGAGAGADVVFVNDDGLTLTNEKQLAASLG